jgi:hypothetical protein
VGGQLGGLLYLEGDAPWDSTAYPVTPSAMLAT